MRTWSSRKHQGRQIWWSLITEEDGFVNEDFNNIDAFAKECCDEVYEVVFYAFEGPHFVVAATLLKIEMGKWYRHIYWQSLSCRNRGLFWSRRKTLWDCPSWVPSDEIKLWSTQLADFLEAAEDAQPIAHSDYDFTENNCVHFARHVWHSLGIPETKELAEFIINNVVNDDGLKDLLEEYGDAGSFRTSAMIAIGGKRAMRQFTSDTVYEQLHIAVFAWGK